MPLRKTTVPQTSPRKTLFFSLLKKAAIPALFIVAMAVFVVLIKRYPHLIGISLETPQQAAIDNASIVREVSQIFQLPDDEEPTVATVTDPLLLQDQTFFAKSKVGDVALVYKNAKKAILYRPSEKKIIEVGVVNNTDETEDPIPSITPENSPTAELSQ